MLTNLIKKIRAKIMPLVKPKSGYFMFRIPKKSLKPLSAKYGFDRGTPIDRFWIESFLADNQRLIHGRCLEVADSHYTKKFAGGRVTQADVLDINPNNKSANIHGDLRNLKSQIKNNTYDCLILTHVLGLIDDYSAALGECWRILKPGGALLFTSSCLGPILEREKVYWRFTPYSAQYILQKFFKPDQIRVKSYGNVLAGQCFWVGMAQQELTRQELSFNDHRYPCITTAVAIK